MGWGINKSAQLMWDAEKREKEIIEKIAKDAGFTKKQIEVLKELRSMFIRDVRNQ